MVQSISVTSRKAPAQTAGPYVHIGLTPNFCGHRAASMLTDLGATMVSEKTQAASGSAVDGPGASTAPARRSRMR